MTSEQYSTILVENIKVGAEMLYNMADDIAGKSDHISELSVTITFDQEMKSVPELTITRSHLPTREQIDYLNSIVSKSKNDAIKDKLKKKGSTSNERNNCC